MYAPVYIEGKQDCWNCLSEYVEDNNYQNVVIGGDLNMILDLGE